MNVATDCESGWCSYGSVNVYIQPTNWFVQPEEASLESLTRALKNHALTLLATKVKAATLHRSFLVRSPKAWFSSVKARVTAEVGSVCFMQPTARRTPRGSWTVRLLRTHKQAKLKSLYENHERGLVLLSSGNSLPLDARSMRLRDAIADDEEYKRTLQQAPQNVFGLCRMPVRSLFSGSMTGAVAIDMSSAALLIRSLCCSLWH